MFKIYGPKCENLGTTDGLRGTFVRMTRLCTRFPEMTPTQCFVVAESGPGFGVPMIDAMQGVYPVER